jgi:hypothetical protein
MRMQKGVTKRTTSKKWQSTGKTPERTWNYTQVEAALAEVFSVAPGRLRGAGNLLVLRGRLKSFQRVGLTPSAPGRGKVIRYRTTDIFTWAIGLALADFGLGPESITQMLKQPWVEGYYAEAAPTGEHLFFVLQPYVLKYTAFPEKKHYVLMRGSRISSNNITALGGRAALIDMTLLREKMDAELERPKPDRRSRPSR